MVSLIATSILKQELQPREFNYANPSHCCKKKKSDNSDCSVC